MEQISQEENNIFLLNNILMSVQFFENYERDIKLLRENWFKEVLLESHHKKCFHADSLFRLSGAKVKFLPRHGMNKNMEGQLHPFRIFISSDNVEAAYDPSALGLNKPKVWPQYQFTVKVNENNEKSGCISLVEFKTIEASKKDPQAKPSRNNLAFNDATETNSNPVYFQRKSIFEEKCNRRLTKTEKLIGLQNKGPNLKLLEKRSSLKQVTTIIEGIIPSNGFYKFQNSEARLKPQSIQEFRMKSSLNNSHEIPPECFQKEAVRTKINSRSEFNECFRSQKVLNSAAFKGYFCDLLIERLADTLNLDLEDVEKSSVLEEFVIVNQKKVQYCITPVIAIKDWNKFVSISRKCENPGKAKKLEWPSKQMQKIMKILSCDVAPTGHTHALEESLEYEKAWKLVFPKAEEFLLLHMMHSHIRCYFFALLIYKSFLETEINCVSFGPKHLLHLLFWRVHKHFLAWPEDRPGETLLTYLKVLYKKLQNKSLCDFFINSRNLFANSLPKDLHKAQALIKKIIENPVPYVIRAIRNLHYESNFYPVFDGLKLQNILITVNAAEKSKKMKKEKKQKMVRFQDEEQSWIKNAMKQIELERKIEEQERTHKLSIETINIEQFLNLNSENLENSSQILKVFAYHFMEMASKSIEFEFFSQALFYLHQTQKVFELIDSKRANQDYTKATRDKINKLKETCYSKLKQDFKKLLPKKPRQKLLDKAEENPSKEEKKYKKYKETSDKPCITAMEKEKETYNSDHESMENEIFSVKL